MLDWRRAASPLADWQFRARKLLVPPRGPGPLRGSVFVMAGAGVDRGDGAGRVRALRQGLTLLFTVLTRLPQQLQLVKLLLQALWEGLAHSVRVPLGPPLLKPQPIGILHRKLGLSTTICLHPSPAPFRPIQ
jgi:hypothetical protein